MFVMWYGTVALAALFATTGFTETMWPRQGFDPWHRCWRLGLGEVSSRSGRDRPRRLTGLGGRCIVWRQLHALGAFHWRGVLMGRMLVSPVWIEICCPSHPAPDVLQMFCSECGTCMQLDRSNTTDSLHQPLLGFKKGQHATEIRADPCGI